MFSFRDSTKSTVKEAEKCLDSQFWHACAGGMVQIPPLNSKVFYFPQGHAEHAHGNVDFGNSSRIPALMLCRIADVNFMADPETDDVYAKIGLVPLKSNETDYPYEDGVYGDNSETEEPQKIASFAKTLTQSDANNGGGFSVPRYCAETIFPRLDYSADPPVQTVLAKDVHGEVWRFRHIYRGTPRRHLLTTGWSAFVNQKKLVAGDSIVFLRTENGDLCVGIRRAKRSLGFGVGNGLESPFGWNATSGNCVTQYRGYPNSNFFREDENKLIKDGNAGNSNYSGGVLKGRTRMTPESVTEAATSAANGQPFEVVYYPRASTPEFCVKASAVRAALRVKWYPGMRFKMPFETEDSSRISWFMGTISSVQVADPVRWPNSPWRLLQVTWDEPDLLQSVKCVSPWLVESVSNMPAIHLSPFSPPRKKLRLPPDFPLDGPFQMPSISSNLFGPSSPLCCVSNDTPAGIQGARHAQFGTSLSNLHLTKQQLGLFPAHFPQQQQHQLNHTAPAPRTSSSSIAMGQSECSEDVSCLLTMGTSTQSSKKSDDLKTPRFVLFGQPILTEQQISHSLSSEGSPPLGRNSSSSDGNNTSMPANGINSGSSSQGFSFKKDSHCRVLMEPNNVGRTLDLSILGSYEELYRKLTNMIGMERSAELSNAVYPNTMDAVKQRGEEPFSSEFTKAARRLTVLTDIQEARALEDR